MLRYYSRQQKTVSHPKSPTGLSMESFITLTAQQMRNEEVEINRDSLIEAIHQKAIKFGDYMGNPPSYEDFLVIKDKMEFFDHATQYIKDWFVELGMEEFSNSFLSSQERHFLLELY